MKISISSDCAYAICLYSSLELYSDGLEGQYNLIVAADEWLTHLHPAARGCEGASFNVTETMRELVMDDWEHGGDAFTEVESAVVVDWSPKEAKQVLAEIEGLRRVLRAMRPK